MALPLPPGLTPAEIAFVAEMELVTVVARQRLDSLSLFSVRTPCFRPDYSCCCHSAASPFRTLPSPSYAVFVVD